MQFGKPHLTLKPCATTFHCSEVFQFEYVSDNSFQMSVHTSAMIEYVALLNPLEKCQMSFSGCPRERDNCKNVNKL